MSSSHKLPVCSNCGYEFQDVNNFCPSCGQKNHEIKIPLKHLLEEGVETTLHLDSKSIRTVKYLVAKPGFLSEEFNAGRRANYVPPIRVYVLISFLFFFLLNLFTGGHKTEDHSQKTEKKTKVTFNFFGINTAELRGLSVAQTDSLIKAKNIEQTNFKKYFIHQMQKAANSSSAEFSHSLLKNISYMMFVLMPLFGAWIYLFNKKYFSYYIEGVTVSIHFHSFFFLFFSLLIFASSITGFELFLLIGFFIVMPGYLYLMLRRITNQKRFITFVKTLLLGVVYFFSLGALIILTVFVSMLFV